MLSISIATGSWRHAQGGQVFSEVMRTHRLRLAITQEELAAKAGLGIRTVRDIEAGRVGRPRQGTVRTLADAFALQGDERESFYLAALVGPCHSPAPYGDSG